MIDGEEALNDEPSDEFTIREMIELHLCGMNAVIDTVPEIGLIYRDARDRLASLLKRLDKGEIVPEYAEVQVEQIDELLRANGFGVSGHCFDFDSDM